MRKLIVFVAAAVLFAPAAWAQPTNLSPRTQTAPACRTSELKACNDKCRQDHDYNVRKLCASGQAADDKTCKDLQSKAARECGSECKKSWCS